MGQKWGWRTTVVLVCVASLAARTRGASPATSGGGKKIFVVVDRGVDEVTERFVKQRNQVGVYLERDLVTRLQRAGFVPALVKSTDEFKGEAGTLLLTAKIVDYDSGGRTTTFVFGGVQTKSGQPSMELRCELFTKKGSEPAMKDDLKVTTRRQSWQAVAQRINALTVSAVQEALGSGE